MVLFFLAHKMQTFHTFPWKAGMNDRNGYPVSEFVDLYV